MLNEMSEEIHQNFGAIPCANENGASFTNEITQRSPIINRLDSFTAYKIMPILNSILMDFLQNKNTNIRVVYEYAWKALKEIA